ncbi:MAG: efflux RND transporter permease subunit [Pseudomonadota bacterium]
MVLSDVSVKRPVFAMVLSMMLLALGIMSFRDLPVREYPDVNPPNVSVSVDYPGASARVVETQITQPLEAQISGVEGIKTIRSSSSDGRTRISIEFELDRNIEEATNDIRDRVARVIGQLPEDADPPEVSKADSDARPIQYFSLNSETMNFMELTDYAERYIIDQLTTIPGVADVSNSGSGRFSMRIWLDRVALAARGLTVTDVENALRRENIELPAGRVESADMEFSVRMERNYQTAEDFAGLVIRRGADGHLIRLGEIADIEIAPRFLRTEYRANGRMTVGFGIVKQSKANSVEVLAAVKEQVAKINASLPEGMELTASSDESIFITAAINSVYVTIAITTVLVSLVILAFLGSFRAMIIPAVTIPICLTASFTILAAFGFSVNLITLLALVLAIGLVVDDSIVVLENIHRRIEEGEPPLLAAYNGARQVAFAVVATTIVLVAVFVPIAFLQDSVGRLFRELAVTISAAVIVSSVLALSLTPVMCSRLLRPHAGENRITHAIDHIFEKVSNGYVKALGACLNMTWAFFVLVALVVAAILLLTRALPEELTPSEDQGSFFAMVQGPVGASFGYMQERMRELEKPLLPLVESGEVTRAMVAFPGFGGNAVNSGVIAVTMAPPDVRTISTQDAIDQVMPAWNEVPGLRVFPRVRSGFSSRSRGGSPVQFVIGGPTYEELAKWRDIVVARAEENPGLTRIDTDLKETQPRLVVSIDKNRAAALGVSVQNVGRTLQAMMSERPATTYVVDGEEYDVLIQAKESQRASPEDLQSIYVRSDASGQLIPLSTLTTVRSVAEPDSLNRHNRIRAVTISASLNEGYTLGEALAFLEGVVRDELPAIAQIDYRGESAEYKEASGGMMFTFVLALLVVGLVLAAQFESFVHPVVIMISVPMAVVGGLFGLLITGNTLNIYSQIGLIMLVGIAAKNGVLIVEFINQLRDEGLAFADAIREAARIRFRPVMMTTLSTVMGSIPLILATGAGAESRITLGIVIFFGVTIATFLTLFVVPVFYQALARNTGSPGAIASELELLQQNQKAVTE